MAFEILVLLALVLVNGVLAGSEIALVAFRRTRIDELAMEGRKGARAARALRDNPEQFLATVQIGITVVGATAGAFGGATFARDLAPVLAKVEVLQPYANEIAFVVVIVLISYASLVLGELVPKSLALRVSEGYALVVSRPLLALSRIARPVVWLLTASSNLILRAFGDRTTFTEARLSREELQQLLDEAAHAGSFHPEASEIASRALDFALLTAGDVMVPRDRIVALPRTASNEEARALVAAHGYSRFPIFESSIDTVVGYLSAKDLLLRIDDPAVALGELMRPADFVPEQKPAVDLLHEMRARRRPFAIVVDERGGTAGLVTMEDLVEELVGEIFSEFATEIPEPIRPRPDGSVLVSGAAPIREVNRALSLGLPEEGDFTSVAGLCLSLFGRIPAIGEKLEIAGAELEVVDASPSRIRWLRLVRKRTP